MADNKVNLLVSLKDQASAGLSSLTNKLGAFGKAQGAGFTGTRADFKFMNQYSGALANAGKAIF